MKKIISFILAVILTVGMCSSVMAAPKTMKNGDIFDAEVYAALYPDVVAAYGTNELNLYNHYRKYGKKEGRIPCLPGADQVMTQVLSQQNTVQLQAPVDTLLKGKSQQYIQCITLLNSCNDIWTLDKNIYLLIDLANSVPTDKERIELNGNGITKGLIGTKRSMLEDAARLPNGAVPTKPGCYIDPSKEGLYIDGMHYVYTYPDGRERWMPGRY